MKLTSPSLREAPTTDTSEEILDALLYSVSHDLRSPLLTLSLSAELIRESARGSDGGGGVEVALDALKVGAEDLERMLKALTTISRGRRRQQERRRVPLGVLLGGHVVISDVVDLERLTVDVDATPVRELLDCLCGAETAEIQLTRTDTHVVFRIPSRITLPELDTSPLLALARSLQQYAGTVIETLASLQLQLARQSCLFELEDGAVRLWLPIPDTNAS